jgi:PAS domain S-box-containing protein
VELCLRAFRNDPARFRVSVAETIRTAREIAGRDPPDLMISDWILPDGKGIDILSRDNGQVTIPLIIMTSFGDERLAVEIMKSGAIDYVVKSATIFKDLPHIAKRALKDWENIHERIRAETAVQATQKRLADIISFLPDAVLAIDNTGTVIAWNKAMEDMSGVPAVNMLGKGDHEYSLPFYGERRPLLIDLVLADDCETEKKYVNIRRDGNRIIAETYIPALFSGRGAYLWGTASPLFDAAGNRIGAIEVIRDITDRKNTETTLRESEEKYRFLIDNVRDIVWQATLDLRFTYLSPAVETLTGYPAGELIGTSLLGILTERSAADIRERVIRRMEAYAHGIRDLAVVFEIELRKRDGSLRWLEVSSNLFFGPDQEPAGFHGISRDITERKRAEEKIRESEERYRALLNGAGIGVGYWSTDGFLLYLNDISLKRLKGTEEDFIGKNIRDLFGEKAEIYLDRIKKAAQSPDPVEYEDYVSLPTGNGWYLSVFMRITGPKGKIWGIQVLSMDITGRKQTEDALKESQIQLRQAMDLAQLVNWEFDALTGLFTFNDRFYTLYGTTADREGGYQMPAKIYTREFVYPDDQHLVSDEVNKALLATDPDFISQAEHRIVRRNGEVRTIVVRFGIIKDENGRTIKTRGANQDITEQKKTELALAASETRFRALIQNSSDIIRILDRDGRITYESPSAGRILGYPPGFIIGKNPRDLVYPEDRERVERDIREVYKNTNKGIPTEFRIRKADGTYLWVDAIGVNLMDVPGINGIVVTIRPVDERKKAEQALLESEERLRLALEGADIASWDWDLVTNKVVFSDKFYAVLDRKPSELPATYETWTALMHPDDRDRVLPDLKRQIQEKRPLCEIEYRLLSNDGNWIWVLCRGTIAQTDEQGNAARLIGVNIDITSRRLMESEIRSLNSVLEERVRDRTEALSKANDALEEENAQRLEAEKKLQASVDEKSMLLKEIHHRVKNNLQIIASLLNLQSRYIRDESTLAAIRESQNRVKAMALVHEKLYRADDISHISLLDYLKFLGTGLFQFYDARSRGIQFRLEIHDVNVDISSAIPLGLIINELISNSLKYAFPEGRKGEIAISVQKDGHTLTVIFSDTGTGIPADLDWQNTQSLGLRLVNTLVDQMNGTIELDRGAGTRFTLVLHEKE